MFRSFYDPRTLRENTKSCFSVERPTCPVKGMIFKPIKYNVTLADKKHVRERVRVTARARERDGEQIA